ncbi:MAG: hypothetical protein E7003_05865 [Eggerthellaceae bacterium]|nr:hypothetical protein [Eggerthellaceae bacterium]
MFDIIIIVVVIVAAFVLALINNKKRREVTVERIRIVRGGMDAFDEEAWAWPEGTGDIVELHPLDTFLGGMVKVIQIKNNTIKFQSSVPFEIEGQKTMLFELARFENLVLTPTEGDTTPIILSYEKMLDPREEQLTPEEQRKRTYAKIMAMKEAEDGAEDQLDEEIEEDDDLGDQIEEKIDDLKDSIEEKLDGLEDKIENTIDDLKEKTEDVFDADSNTDAK